jgi:hypothetical protein
MWGGQGPSRTVELRKKEPFNVRTEQNLQVLNQFVIDNWFTHFQEGESALKQK